MKKSELKKLVSNYRDLKLKISRRNLPHDHTLSEKLDGIKHRYFHETGSDIEYDLKSNAGHTA
ncbi:hypothetical protein QVH35_08550 [Candidatus Nitrosotenuis chungbukensis]|uniref:hypothetical protein n=1 Tax=Candidatus Nitrosotenuis chungbukensis TaxID=1353246 RepID=UPI0005B28D12|nr:hypothetical protein [Candidatus Nitrosotenuis chungbukensis]WKT57435.1 hypothetical protein QVH35_08550 [Candidatus Nitrosotenuis chungbukensis]